VDQIGLRKSNKSIMKKGTEIAPKIFEELNYKCAKCELEYGNEPNYCHGCGCNYFIKI